MRVSSLLAIAKAIAKGGATTPTVIPANKSFVKSVRLYPVNVLNNWGRKNIPAMSK